MSQSLPDNPVNEARNVQSSDSSLVLSSALSPLVVPELLQIILGDLGGRDIVLAARVCRTWSEPALDRIWRRMHSLVPLFSLIGPMGRNISGEWAFKDGIKDSDWSRYSVYAPRIREVTIRDYDRAEWVSVQVLSAILAHLPSHLQLPLPASIHLLVTAPAPATLLQLPLISQSLRKLTLSQLRSPFNHASSSFVTYLQGVIQSASRLHHPCLEEFQVCCFTSSAALIKAFDACLIKHGSCIAGLTARFPFDGQVWASIFSLPALQTLALAPLNLSTSMLGTSEALIPMVQTLVERQPLLRSLRLDLGFALHGDPSYSPYSRIIHDLMGLRNLETLILYISLPLYLSESEVRGMGASWPKMRILEFRTVCYWTGNFPVLEAEPQSDLSLLPHFLHWFSFLEELRVSFICNHPLKAPQQQLPASISRFHTLDLGKCPKPEEGREEVVAYLAAVVPRHTRIQHRNLYGDRRTFWDGVAYHLDSIWRAAQQTDLQASV